MPCSYDELRNKQPVLFGDWEVGTSDWEKMKEKDRGFESLQFYQDSLKLLKASYKLAGNLPNYERYNVFATNCAELLVAFH